MRQLANDTMTVDEARDMIVRVTKAFQPRTPITTRELFAGRWTEITTLSDAVGQTGLHVVIYGERGVGKTSLANVVRPVIQVLVDNNTEGRLIMQLTAEAADGFSSIWHKIFKDIMWSEDRPAFGLSTKQAEEVVSVDQAFALPDKLSADDVRRVITKIPGAVFIIDEFDRAAGVASKQFTDLIKALADRAVDCTIILVGVSETVDELIVDHASIHRSLIQIQLPRMKPAELKEIIDKAEKQLDISFNDDAAALIVRMSQGLPHYTHLLGQHAVRQAANDRRSRLIELSDVFAGLKEAVKQAQQSVTKKHSTSIHSAHKDALYRHVLLACALAASQTDDPLGFFSPSAIAHPLGVILNRVVQIATFSNHLAEFSQAKRGAVLERIGQARAYRFRFRDPLLAQPSHF